MFKNQSKNSRDHIMCNFSLKRQILYSFFRKDVNKRKKEIKMKNTLIYKQMELIKELKLKVETQNL